MKVYGKRTGPYAVLSAEMASSCKAKVVVDSKTGEPINGRCRMHGGLSTGAKTQEGKDKSREAARRGMLAYWAKKK